MRAMLTAPSLRGQRCSKCSTSSQLVASLAQPSTAVPRWVTLRVAKAVSEPRGFSMANDTNGHGADIRLIQAVHNTFRTGLTRLIDATAKVEPSALATSLPPYWDFYAAILD